MSYYSADLSPLAASLPRTAMGLFTVVCPDGSTEVTPRLDIALALRSGLVRSGRPKARASTRQEAARARARQAVAKADAILGRRCVPRGTSLSAVQRGAINKLGNADLMDAVGRVIGQALRQRDDRIKRLEGQMLARDPMAVRARALAAVRAASNLLAA
ncbi:hypothetical protein [Variovorax rhizosphaerae]|uniref:DUF4102 domain-containing protein n=1 Tax=Variovorax rhizosphaerae TaxID=1836200 RepID=A0ABU8WSG6_9BURK